jgi:hypothetical protein
MTKVRLRRRSIQDIGPRHGLGASGFGDFRFRVGAPRFGRRLRAAVVKVDITPATPWWLLGMSRDRPRQWTIPYSIESW